MQNVNLVKVGKENDKTKTLLKIHISEHTDKKVIFTKHKSIVKHSKQSLCTLGKIKNKKKKNLKISRGYRL